MEFNPSESGALHFGRPIVQGKCPINVKTLKIHVQNGEGNRLGMRTESLAQCGGTKTQKT